MIAKTFEFDAEIIKHEKLDAAFIEFPYDVEKEFGKKGQVKVQVTFDGHAYRGSLAKMGYRCHRLGLTKEIRNVIGKNPGNMVHVVVKEDIEPRLVEIPVDFAKLLDENPDAKANFEKLSFTHRKEYTRWITGAKKEETRAKRLCEAIPMLLDNIKHP
ncbi:MAG: YdeI/OmpD-associated family protein [Acidobacteria bacterium]|jgi:hypothetical protein|nr:YdeI/OmpD-associated family protein [Acidobacteriota bacterium]